ncbi:hypothetical protein GOBAR_DD24382 [Gossypium barbadense]|nr:hypothetical protein GOBAR_DD24382 [Gossypium barbadense]
MSRILLKERGTFGNTDIVGAQLLSARVNRNGIAKAQLMIMLSRTRVRAPWYILARFQAATQIRFRIAKAQLMIMSSPNRVRAPLLNPSPITPSHKQTTGDKLEEGEDDIKSSCPLCLGRHMCYTIDGTKGHDPARVS